MARLYSKLLALQYSSEKKPVLRLTEQAWYDSLFLIRGHDEGRLVWHYVIVPYEKLSSIKMLTKDEHINTVDFGNIVQYKGNRGQIFAMSGWGTYIFPTLERWIQNHYELHKASRNSVQNIVHYLDNVTIDENIDIKYSKDDIRLCTMQCFTNEEKLGFWYSYSKSNHFHFIKLFEDYQATLAYRAGIKNFDRLIALNGINIEKEALEQVSERIHKRGNLPIQMLVASPATYHHYKLNNMTIDADLPSVQYLKPVFSAMPNIGSSALTNLNAEKKFSVLQLDNSNISLTIEQSSIFKAPEVTHLDDVCYFENQGKYQKGRIKFIGTKYQCEEFRQKVKTHSRDENDLKWNDSISMDRFPNRTQFEDLPNELMYEILKYLTVRDMFHAFINLNNRLNSLIRSRENLFIIFDEQKDQPLKDFYKFDKVHLIVDTPDPCDLSQFSNIQSLVLFDRNSTHIDQIRPEIMPNLVYLSFVLQFHFQPPKQLVDQIFSNKFPKLRCVNLGYIELFNNELLSMSYSLKILSICCSDTVMIKYILRSCPNLQHLQIRLLACSNQIEYCTSSIHHQLKRFTLWTHLLILTQDQIDAMLSHVSNVTHLYLQTTFSTPVVDILETIMHRLPLLSQFDCVIKEEIVHDKRTTVATDFHSIASCFRRIECIVDENKFRIFATE